jgi:hypothetical protein
MGYDHDGDRNVMGPKKQKDGTGKAINRGMLGPGVHYVKNRKLIISGKYLIA